MKMQRYATLAAHRGTTSARLQRMNIPHVPPKAGPGEEFLPALPSQRIAGDNEDFHIRGSQR